MTPSEYVRLLLDPVRLAVAGHAAAGGNDIAALAQRLGVDHRVVAEARGKLLAAGLITEDGLNVELMRAIARSLPTAPPVADSIVHGPWTVEEVETLSRFFSGGRLQSIPGNLSKRRVVLERLAQEFEPGLRYEEPDVNFRLQLFYSDYAALRRYLVDEGMLSRADGVYWRTGGRHTDDVGPEAAADDG